MVAQEGDWILHRSGPVMKVGVVRYVLKDEPFSYGKTFYQTDDEKVCEDCVYEVRPKGT